MSKRWTMREDLFLHAYFDAVGDFAGTHDLGRPKGAAAKRVARLKESGAWAALDARETAETAYRHALGIFNLEELDAMADATCEAAE